MFQSENGTSQYADEILYSASKDQIWLWDQRRKKLKPYVFEAEKSDISKFYFMRNHSGAGIVWDSLNQMSICPNGARVLHIDAHDDLKIEWPLPHDVNEMKRRKYQVGSFIAPRVSTGIIGAFYWVKPFENTKPALASDIDYLKNQYGLQITESSKLPEVPSVDIIDIDLDYFTALVSGGWPKQYLIYVARKKFAEIIRKFPTFKVITIASSPGFIRWRHERVLIETAITYFSNLRQ